jgi:REP element-mobilizing transposase RayT
MPRRPRAFHAGIYHVAARGSDTRHLFVTDHDRHDFLQRLAQTCELFELALISYVLMGTHYHTLIRIPDARISLALQCLHTEYSRWHNRRHGRRAHLFRAHPLAREISSDRQLIAAARYLALNPVEAGLVSDALEWPWSSARAHAGMSRPRIPLFEHDLLAAFGGGAAWRTEYRTQIERDAS